VGPGHDDILGLGNGDLCGPRQMDLFNYSAFPSLTVGFVVAF
jgi:hypothetical protein